MTYLKKVRYLDKERDVYDNKSIISYIDKVTIKNSLYKKMR